MTDRPQSDWVAPGSAQPPAQQAGGPSSAAGPPTPPPYPSYPAPAYAYPPQFRPAHKPGIVALRPLGLGDLYDGALNAIRRNPKPMVGLSMLVVTAFLALPAMVTLVLGMTGNLALPSLDDPSASSEIDPGMVATLVGSLFGYLAGIVLTGMLVHVVAQAVLGHKATVEGTWRAVRGRLLRLFGLTLVSLLTTILPIAVLVVLVVALAAAGLVLLAVAVGILGTLGVVALVAYIQVRLVLLAAPALVVERLGVLQSMRRAHSLSRRQFWRLLGISLLTGVITSFVGQILNIPFAVAGVVGVLVIDDRTAAALVYVFSSYVALILVQSVTTPFSSAVRALLYVDQRIRKEAYDVELIALSQDQSAPAKH